MAAAVGLPSATSSSSSSSSSRVFSSSRPLRRPPKCQLFPSLPYFFCRLSLHHHHNGNRGAWSRSVDLPRAAQSEAESENVDEGTLPDPQVVDLPSAKVKADDFVKNALERAAAYKKTRKSSEQDVSQVNEERKPFSPSQKVEILAGKPESSRTDSSERFPSKAGSSTTSAERQPSLQSGVASDLAGSTSEEVFGDEALEGGTIVSSARQGISQEEAVFGSAFRNAEAFKKQELDMVSALNTEGQDASMERAREGSSDSVEVEIYTRDGVINRKVLRPDESFTKIKERKRSGVSSTDFMGLGFSDRKAPGKPAGLMAGLEVPPPGTLPEIEIITRDGEKAETASSDGANEEGLYKPKVATWGIFARPANISRTYGGGRTIKPGDQLETEEEKQAREARTKQLLDAYRKKIGLDVEPKIKADCALALKQGNDLLDKGKLQNALGYFEKVMQQMPYQSELHGLAALQWSVCLDSLNRSQEARLMYEKIASHPNILVRKKAKQFLFSFQAMENLKLSTSYKWDSTTYRRYFDAFADGYNTMYKASKEDMDGEEMNGQTFLYVIFLAFPLLLIFTLIVLKGTQNL